MLVAAPWRTAACQRDISRLMPQLVREDSSKGSRHILGSILSQNIGSRPNPFGIREVGPVTSRSSDPYQSFIAEGNAPITLALLGQQRERVMKLQRHSPAKGCFYPLANDDLHGYRLSFRCPPNINPAHLPYVVETAKVNVVI